MSGVLSKTARASQSPHNHAVLLPICPRSHARPFIWHNTFSTWHVTETDGCAGWIGRSAEEPLLTAVEFLCCRPTSATLHKKQWPDPRARNQAQSRKAIHQGRKAHQSCVADHLNRPVNHRSHRTSHRRRKGWWPRASCRQT